MATTTYAEQYGILDTARRMVERDGDQYAERRAIDYAFMASRGSERRNFWMRVAQVVAEFRAEVRS